ncbi:MAG: 50S ribosomal protein L6 [Elusimicrobia bacterium]|nr:50S ribosomal protein L6 [Elusimicrobiota bacterium]MBD3412091.1 50S ribosomal protein L6 [Elusimicrobiota bacterium]
MSRVGKNPVTIPDKVKVSVQGQRVSIQGPLGKHDVAIHPKISVKLEKNTVNFSRSSDDERDRSLHGLERARIANLVTGVSTGFKKDLQLMGVGYRAQISGSTITLSLGFSHPVEFKLPQGIQAKIEKMTLISLAGTDKELLGLTAARLRALRPPEPYKGKGIRYAGEHIIRKAGKAAVAGGKKA